MTDRFQSHRMLGIIICTIAVLLPALSEAALPRFIVENRTAATTLSVTVEQDGATLGQGKAKPGEDYKYKGLVCKATICTYKVYAKDGEGNKTLIGSGGLITKDDDLKWYDDDGDGSKRDDVANDVFTVNNNKSKSTPRMKILKVTDN